MSARTKYLIAGAVVGYFLLPPLVAGIRSRA